MIDNSCSTSLINMGLLSGTSSLVLGGILLLAVAIDVPLAEEPPQGAGAAYVSPTYFKLPPLR